MKTTASSGMAGKDLPDGLAKLALSPMMPKGPPPAPPPRPQRQSHTRSASLDLTKGALPAALPHTSALAPSTTVTPISEQPTSQSSSLLQSPTRSAQTQTDHQADGGNSTDTVSVRRALLTDGNMVDFDKIGE